MVMSDKARTAKKEYMRTWRATHQQEISIYQERYWEKKADINKEAAND